LHLKIWKIELNQMSAMCEGHSFGVLIVSTDGSEWWRQYFNELPTTILQCCIDICPTGHDAIWHRI